MDRSTNNKERTEERKKEN